jgi:protein SCO1/2
MSLRLRLTLALGGLALAAALATMARSALSHPPLPVLGQMPAFRLVDQRGSPFGDASMRGHVSVVDFIFTRCASSCPQLTARMGDLQERLALQKSSARLVSFSVDPENDTPAVLSEYAARAHADPARWSFVTGAQDDVMRAVVRGFKVSAEKVARDAGDYDVIHGNWFVVVDARGQVRGYYAIHTATDLDVLVNDARLLERGG